MPSDGGIGIDAHDVVSTYGESVGKQGYSLHMTLKSVEYIYIAHTPPLLGMLERYEPKMCGNKAHTHLFLERIIPGFSLYDD